MILELVYLLIIIIISITVHEYTHAYISYKLWDPSPKINKKLSINPIKHLSIIWLIFAFLINFSRSRPTQTNSNYYKDKTSWEIIFTVSWPISNLLLSIIWVFILFFYSKYIVWIQSAWSIINSDNQIIFFLTLFSIINIILAIFNFLPIPPLDWFRLLKLKNSFIADFIKKYSIYLYIVIFILVIIPISSDKISQYIYWVWETIFWIIFIIISKIFY